MSADLIAKWRIVAANLETVETKFLTASSALASAKLQRDVVAQCVARGTGDTAVLDDLKSQAAALRRQASDTAQQTQALEAWCRKRAAKNKTHLDTLRDQVAAVRDREEACECPLPRPQECLAQERRVHAHEEELRSLRAATAERKESLALAKEVRRLEVLAEGVAAETAAAKALYDEGVRRAEAMSADLAAAVAEASAGLETQSELRRRILCARPIVERANDTMNRLAFPEFPKAAMAKLQSVVDRFCELDVAPAADAAMPPSTRRRLVRPQ